MPRRPVLSPEAPAPSGGYSQGIVAGDLLYLSGQGPYDASGARVGTTVAEQVRQVLANLDAVARAAGGSLQDAVRVGMYISDLADLLGDRRSGPGAGGVVRTLPGEVQEAPGDDSLGVAARRRRGLRREDGPARHHAPTPSAP